MNHDEALKAITRRQFSLAFAEPARTPEDQLAVRVLAAADADVEEARDVLEALEAGHRLVAKAALRIFEKAVAFK